MQHGQKITMAPKQLLKAAGFTVREPAEGHLCCGSAGTYNIMQPDISAALKARKVKNIEATKPDVIATGNIGCITQIATGTAIPILHTVELLDWAYGGDVPQKLRDLPLNVSPAGFRPVTEFGTMRRITILLAGLLGAAEAAHADSRFFCSADDSSARFTIESGFRDEAGHQLNHFRGALIVKNNSVPDAFKKRVFNSSKLTNRWSA